MAIDGPYKLKCRSIIPGAIHYPSPALQFSRAHSFEAKSRSKSFAETEIRVRCTLDRENALVHVTADVSCDGQTGVTASAERVTDAKQGGSEILIQKSCLGMFGHVWVL